MLSAISTVSDEVTDIIQLVLNYLFLTTTPQLCKTYLFGG